MACVVHDPIEREDVLINPGGMDIPVAIYCDFCGQRVDLATGKIYNVPCTSALHVDLRPPCPSHRADFSGWTYVSSRACLLCATSTVGLLCMNCNQNEN